MTACQKCCCSVAATAGWRCTSMYSGLPEATQAPLVFDDHCHARTFLQASMERPVKTGTGLAYDAVSRGCGNFWQGCVRDVHRTRSEPFSSWWLKRTSLRSAAPYPALRKGLKLVLVYDGMSALFHSQGVLHCAQRRACGGCSVFPSMASRRRVKRPVFGVLSSAGAHSFRVEKSR